jgi:hypothetical protein
MGKERKVKHIDCIYKLKGGEKTTVLEVGIKECGCIDFYSEFDIRDFMFLVDSAKEAHMQKFHRMRCKNG